MCYSNKRYEKLNPKGFPWPSPSCFGGQSNPIDAEKIIQIIQKLISAGDVQAKLQSYYDVVSL